MFVMKKRWQSAVAERDQARAIAEGQASRIAALEAELAQRPVRGARGRFQPRVVA